MKEELEIEMVRYMKLSPELTHRKHETQQCGWKREDPGAQERIKMIRAFQEEICNTYQTSKKRFIFSDIVISLLRLYSRKSLKQGTNIYKDTYGSIFIIKNIENSNT